MNELYEKLLRELRQPEYLVDCMTGRIKSPLDYLESPPAWVGFPPALIPIWNEGINYLAYWKHYFSGRPGTFVSFYREFNGLEELARTSDQLMAYFALHAVCLLDTIDAGVQRFAEQVGLRNLEELESVAVKTGDRLEGLTGMSQFKQLTPLGACSDVAQYDGWFPSVGGRPELWLTACAFELPDEDEVGRPLDLPAVPWLADEETRRASFAPLLEASDLSGAWLVLNGPGWPVSEARAALSNLRDRADDSLFSLHCDAWLQLTQDRLGDYY